jgi:hypothetical protein
MKPFSPEGQNPESAVSTDESSSTIPKPCGCGSAPVSPPIGGGRGESFPPAGVQGAEPPATSRSPFQMAPPPPAPEPCCGAAPAEPKGSDEERPGYSVWHFVEEFRETPAGLAPRVKTAWERSDYVGAFLTRTGIGAAGYRAGWDRSAYKVAPGLYCVGEPNADAPVIVTANYKLTFDHVRRALDGVAAWILVLETWGVNVWCAAGKGTFGTDEVIRRVKATGLDRVVNHREIIVPQFGAVGVAAHKVVKGCGFRVLYGPVQARDLKGFLQAGKKTDTAMRRVTFDFWERAVLTPVEVTNLFRPRLLLILLGLFIVSGIAPSIFEFGDGWTRGLAALAALAAGVLAGAVAVPILLPWIPGRSFYLKGAILGVLAGAGAAACFWGQLGQFGELGGLGGVSMVLAAAAVSSWMAMNFTGCTPYTSPSGVEKEMRRGIPLQIAAVVVAVVVWVAVPFIA